MNSVTVWIRRFAVWIRRFAGPWFDRNFKIIRYNDIYIVMNINM